jgi:predicted DNA-binding protein (MmcQ/YjbR family)
MNVSDFRDYCLSKNGVTEGFPFDNKTLVFKVGNKMFALADVDNFTSINLKCDPERAIELRETYHGINPGYHMSKVHWNTVAVHEDVSLQLLVELIDHSYDLIFASLPRKVKDELSH